MLGITATVVTNTLIMAVFERTREIGILAAIGMKARAHHGQFLTEAGLIATGGVIGGLDPRRDHGLVFHHLRFLHRQLWA